MCIRDSYCKYFSDAELISAIKGETDRNMLSNVPFVIWTEGITPQVYGKYVSTMDIAPTIVDLFSLDADLRYYIGNDMFGPDGGVVYFRNYAWYDGKTYEMCIRDREYSTYVGMASGWVTGIGKTYLCWYDLDSTMLIGKRCV